jgi:hypothetical protein
MVIDRAGNGAMNVSTGSFGYSSAAYSSLISAAQTSPHMPKSPHVAPEIVLGRGGATAFVADAFAISDATRRAVPGRRGHNPRRPFVGRGPSGRRVALMTALRVA